MSTSQLLLNLGLLALVLGLNLGTRTYSSRRAALPLLLAAVAGWVYLHDLPTAGYDVRLELVGAAAGAALGVLAALLVGVRAGRDGVVRLSAGAGYAAVWVLAIGGRVAFAYGATYLFPHAIAQFSMNHRITGADAWTAALVLMALAMVATRTLVTATQVLAATRSTAPRALAAS